MKIIPRGDLQGKIAEGAYLVIENSIDVTGNPPFTLPDKCVIDIRSSKPFIKTGASTFKIKLTNTTVLPSYTYLKKVCQEQGISIDDAGNPAVGTMDFDEVNGKPIWYTATGWVYADGTPVS